MSTIELPNIDLPEFSAPETSDIFNRAVCLRVSIKGFTNSKKLKAHQYQTAAPDQEMTKASKKKLVSAELDAINERDANMRNWLRDRSLPSPLGGGVYMIPVTQLGAVRAELEKWAGTSGIGGERGDLIAAFIHAYPAAYRSAKDKLGDLFSEGDYPVTADMLDRDPTLADLIWRAFDARWQFFSFQTPQALRRFDENLFLAEAEKAAEEWKEFRGQVSSMLRQEMTKLVDDMVSKVSGTTKSGRKQTIRESFLPQLNEWLELVNDRNIHNDQSIRQLSEQMKNLLQGVDDKSLRTNQDVRNRLAEGFSQIREQLTENLENAPIRAFSFDDEDED